MVLPFLPLYQMTNLILLRHGQSYTNSGKYVHHDNQNLLTVKGINDTVRHAGNFRKMFPEMHFDHVFVSPMHRAQQTAFNFLSTFDNKAINIEVVEDFRERHFGFTGFLKMADMIELYGQDTVDSWEFDIDSIPGDGGESLSNVYDRVIDSYEKYVVPRLKAGDQVLVVSHYYVMKCLQSYIQFGDIHMAPIFEPKNCLPQPYKII